MKMAITHVIDTHIHADHLSGARKLARELGAQLCFHESAPVKFDYLPLRHAQRKIERPSRTKSELIPGLRLVMPASEM